MSFRKNQRRDTFGYQKVEGKVYVPIAGKTILEGSTIDHLLLDASSQEALILYGAYEVNIDGTKIKHEELVEEYIDFLNQLLIGSTIRSAIVHSQLSLTITIDSNPPLSIYIDNTIPHYWDVAWEHRV
ncbi:MAG: hypothetical protein AAF587_05535 [Bacteroidota bacterium]